MSAARECSDASPLRDSRRQARAPLAGVEARDCRVARERGEAARATRECAKARERGLPRATHFSIHSAQNTQSRNYGGGQTETR